MADADPVLLSNAMLVVSELVTNVVRHVPAGVQREWVKVRLGLADDFVRLEVIDPGTTYPEPRFTPLTQGSMQQTGRGLGLVAALAIRHGTQLLAGGHRVVWADLTHADAANATLVVATDVQEQVSAVREPR